MSNILEQLVTSKYFVPSTADEYLALQLAKGLSDESSILHYVRYVERHPVPSLLRYFHQAKQEQDPAQAFHSFLISLN